VAVAEEVAAEEVAAEEVVAEEVVAAVEAHLRHSQGR